MTATTLDITTWPTALELRAAASESAGATGDGRGQPELFESIGAAFNLLEVAANEHASEIDSVAAETTGNTSNLGALAAPHFLVTASDAALPNEVVVGNTPGGELAGGGSSWTAPKVSSTHASGQTHAQVQAAAETTAAAALTAHGIANPAHPASSVSVLDAAGILVATTVEAALAEVRQDVVDRLEVNVKPLGILASNSGATNAFIFNVLAVSAPYASETVDWVFPEAAYDTTGFQVSKSNHRIVSKCKGGTTFNYVGAGSTPCVTFTGTTVGAFAGRIENGGMVGITVNNLGTSAPEASQALKIRHATHMQFERCYFTGFRGDGAIDASNFADSMFAWCDFQYNGSIDDSDKSVVKFHDDDDNNLWNNDAIVFLRCNFEQNGDRLLDFRTGSGAGAGLQVNKIFMLGCKFESSQALGYNMGGSAGSGAQFYFDNCGQIAFCQCDITLQGMRTGHALIPAAFKLVNITDLHLVSCVWHIGSGANPQCFTNFILANNANQVVSLADFWIDSGNDTAYPTLVLKASNTPRLAQHGVGFTPLHGGTKVATDWYTAAEWQEAGTGGVIA